MDESLNRTMLPTITLHKYYYYFKVKSVNIFLFNTNYI